MGVLFSSSLGKSVKSAIVPGNDMLVLSTSKQARLGAGAASWETLVRDSGANMSPDKGENSVWRAGSVGVTRVGEGSEKLPLCSTEEPSSLAESKSKDRSDSDMPGESSLQVDSRFSHPLRCVIGKRDKLVESSVSSVLSPSAWGAKDAGVSNWKSNGIRCSRRIHGSIGKVPSGVCSSAGKA